MSKNKNTLNKLITKFHTGYLIVRENLKYLFFKNTVVLDGSPHSKNFGDALNIYIVEKITNKHVIFGAFLKRDNIKTLACIGSILSWCDKNSTIWGAGFMKPVENCENQFEGRNIYAVRGYKTLEILKENNYDISNIKIGDPALLLPQLHKKTYTKGTKIGILPHYVDKNNHWIKEQISKSNNIRFIDIECGKDVDGFLDAINDCEVILSSTLHGLIIADSYNIKNVWVKFSKNISGGNFKYNDYYSSIGVEDREPVFINDETDLKDIIKKAKVNEIQLDLDELMQSLPKL